MNESDSKNHSESEIDWEANSRTLLKQIETLLEEKKTYREAIKRLLITHEISSEEVEKLKVIVAERDEDQQLLWQEIEALRHENNNLIRAREFERKSFEAKNENLLRRATYLDEMLQRQIALALKYEKEIEKRELQYRELRNSKGWKIGKTFAKESLRIPLDLSDLPSVPEAPQEPEYLDEPDASDFKNGEPFDRLFKKSGARALGWTGVVETPKSFASPAVGQKAKVTGWCYDVDGGAPIEVWATMGGERVPFAYGLQRPDVIENSAHQAANIAENCGFAGEVTTGPGENFIEVHARFADQSVAMIGKRIVVNLGLERTPKRALDDEYQSWIACFDELTLAETVAMREQVGQFEHQPLISILLPVYNTESKWLTQAIESVRAQIYEHWELCIADDASPMPHVREILEEYQRKDSRIKVVYREKNGHIAAATNSALEIAQGSYCALLDHDDMLPVHALFHLVESINARPDADLFFSDEDKIDSEGRRFDPYFKSDWNPDLFLSHNCISHLGVYRTSILRAIEGFNEALSGSQDWDLALRFLLQTDRSKIVHIPKILYHWRYLDTSTAKSIDTKPYALEAGKRAIEGYLEARGQEAEVVQGMWPGSYRVKYRASEQTKASIIIPTRDQRDVTERCIRSILEKSTYPNYEIILVNNQSSEATMLEYLDALEQEARVKVIAYDQPFNFSAINNFAAREASGDVLVFLNNDMEVIEPDWLTELVSQSSREEIGAAGGWLLYPDHTVQHAGVLLGVGGIAVEAFKHQLEWNIGHMGRAHLNQNYSAVTGACLATRKDVFDKLGGFNEQDLSVAYNDVDYCLRVQRDLGLWVTWTPHAKLFHHESVSRGYEISEEKKERLEFESSYMRKQWAEVITKDPFYNPNLSKYSTDFSLAWPPRSEV